MSKVVVLTNYLTLRAPRLPAIGSEMSRFPTEFAREGKPSADMPSHVTLRAPKLPARLRLLVPNHLTLRTPEFPAMSSFMARLPALRAHEIPPLLLDLVFHVDENHIVVSPLVDEAVQL